MRVTMSKLEFEAEMVSRGYHVVPKRCSTCGGNHGLYWKSPFNYLGDDTNRLFCEGCHQPEDECKCK